MGNEKSALTGLEIDAKAVEITDFWLHHSARVHEPNPQSLSVFISEPTLHSSPNFGKPAPLERTAKSLMLHRHPCILKYISSWHKGSKYFLATEEVKPLVQVIGTQTSLQICIGLHNILRALIFLHEKALASHNNVCSSSIYVTPDGFWKLGGLEYLCRFTELTPAYLQKTRNHRYDKAISPEENSGKSAVLLEPTAIDQFAFGVLVEEVLRLKNDDDVPALPEFRELCKRQLQNTEPSLRTKLSSVLVHPFFTHEFITIHSFFMELPLKNDAEKQKFFSNIVEQLKNFPEKIVAEQLGSLLLSRMVLLDSTAQIKLLPVTLTPINENNESNIGLFTMPTFKKYLVPKLLQMFRLRDAQIRLLLLSHFNSFLLSFQEEELQSEILPELLVGIKDTDDLLVSTTLRALADLVPILGAATVIGGNRGKLFTDGRPNKEHKQRLARASNKTIQKQNLSNAAVNPESEVLNLPERPSPDGGEDRIESTPVSAEEEGTWSDWDAQESSTLETTSTIVAAPETVNLYSGAQTVDAGMNSLSGSPRVEPGDKTKYMKKSIISDISELDIKNFKPTQPTAEEFDFFTDMVPVIKKTQVLHIEESIPSKSMFEVKLADSAVEVEGDEGWGDDINDWGTEDSSELRD